VHEDDAIEFGTLTPEGYTPGRTIPRLRILKCPQVILLPEHYPTEGEAADTCLCYIGHGGEYIEDPVTGAPVWKPYDGPHGWDEEPEDEVCPDCEREDCLCPDPDAGRDRGRDDPDLFDERGRLWPED
jgi:hypothetical protein